MKQAKPILSLLLAALITFSLGTFSATAAEVPMDRELKAQILCALGLFKGYDNTGMNFGLSDPAPREQSLIFLIRILGEEKAAAGWTGPQPYSDVASGDYFYSYVGYAKEKGYTNGVGDHKFGKGQSASMAQMATFALRGLGYSEAAGDFTYQSSVSVAASMGILDSTATPVNFTRGHAVDVLYGAAATKVKNQTYTLLEKLIAGGTVTQAQVDLAGTYADGTAQGKSDIAAGTYALRCMGNQLRVTGDKLMLQKTVPAQSFIITNQDRFSYIQTVEGHYLGVTGVEDGTQLVLGSTPYAWLIRKESGSDYTICPAEKPGMKVSTNQGRSTDGTRMILWTIADTPKNALITFADPNQKIAATGIKLNKTAADLEEGETLRLTGIVIPSNADHRTLTWTSDAPQIATVSSEGLVTAGKAGTATITAKTADGGQTATCVVTVKISDRTYIDKTVHLYNSANQAATDIRLSVCTENDWGENLISAPLQPDASVELLVPVAAIDYLYDVTILFADGTKATFNGYNFKKFTSGGSLYAYISKIGTLKLSTTRPDPAAAP
ncbi:MAG: Ig-like domain-containing protein [Pseudoflavonifractor sp.]